MSELDRNIVIQNALALALTEERAMTLRYAAGGAISMQSAIDSAKIELREEFKAYPEVVF